MNPPIPLVFAFAALASPSLPAVEPASPPVPADRVGFPTGYQNFTAIRTANKVKLQLFATIYANEQAATVAETAHLPYPDGSVIVMEWAQPVKDDSGALRTDANGLWLKGEVVRVDVMRRGTGLGDWYGKDRAGSWEFASYLPNGDHKIPPAETVSCAKCHVGATAERDYVFQGRFPPLKPE